MTEICHQERVHLRELIDLLPYLKRLVQLDKENSAAIKPAQPQPVATLCEVVEKLISDWQIQKDFPKAVSNIRVALTAERKRAVLVDELIIASRAIAQFNTEDHGIRFPCVRCALDALDAFDKGAENG